MMRASATTAWPSAMPPSFGGKLLGYEDAQARGRERCGRGDEQALVLEDAAPERDSVMARSAATRAQSAVTAAAMRVVELRGDDRRPARRARRSSTTARIRLAAQDDPACLASPLDADRRRVQASSAVMFELERGLAFVVIVSRTPASDAERHRSSRPTPDVGGAVESCGDRLLEQRPRTHAEAAREVDDRATRSRRRRSARSQTRAMRQGSRMARVAAGQRRVSRCATRSNDSYPATRNSPPHERAVGAVAGAVEGDADHRALRARAPPCSSRCARGGAARRSCGSAVDRLRVARRGVVRDAGRAR